MPKLNKDTVTQPSILCIFMYIHVFVLMTALDATRAFCFILFYLKTSLSHRVDSELFIVSYISCHLPLLITLVAYVWDKWDYWCWTVTLQALRDDKAIKCCFCSSSASQTNKPGVFRQESIYLTQSLGPRTEAEQGILSFSFSLFFPLPFFLSLLPIPLPFYLQAYSTHVKNMLKRTATTS